MEIGKTYKHDVHGLIEAQYITDDKCACVGCVFDNNCRDSLPCLSISRKDGQQVRYVKVKAMDDHKHGQIVELQGKRVRVISTPKLACEKCCFHGNCPEGCNAYPGVRKDNKHFYYIEYIEPNLGDVIDFCGKRMKVIKSNRSCLGCACYPDRKRICEVSDASNTRKVACTADKRKDNQYIKFELVEDKLDIQSDLPLGAIVKHNSVQLEVVSNAERRCSECYFKNKGDCFTRKCVPSDRSDKKYVKFVEVAVAATPAHTPTPPPAQISNTPTIEVPVGATIIYRGKLVRCQAVVKQKCNECEASGYCTQGVSLKCTSREDECKVVFTRVKTKG